MIQDVYRIWDSPVSVTISMRYMAIFEPSDTTMFSGSSVLSGIPVTNSL